MGNKTKPIRSVTDMGVTNSDLLEVARPININYNNSNSKETAVVNYQSNRIKIRDILKNTAAATVLAFGLVSGSKFIENVSATPPAVPNQNGQFLIGKQIPQNILNNPNTHINYGGGGGNVENQIPQNFLNNPLNIPNTHVTYGSTSIPQIGFVPPYIIPTLTPGEIKYKGNQIYIDGIEFLSCNISPNASFKSNGSLYKPYVKVPYEVKIPTQLSGMVLTQELPTQISNIVKTDWSMGEILETEKGDNPFPLVLYDGKGHYVFKVAIKTLGEQFKSLGKTLEIQPTSGTGEKVIYVETPNKITYKEFLTDINTLYKFNKNTAAFFGDNNSEFIKKFLKIEDVAHLFLHLETNVQRVVPGNTFTYNLLGESISVEFPKGFEYKLMSPNEWLKNLIPAGISFNDMFCIYRGEEFKYQKVNYVPGYGDGTKEFPFQIFKNRPVWSGKGYYAFADIASFPAPRSFESMPQIHLETVKEITNKNELKNLYKKVYENGSVYQNPNSKGNFEFYGVNIGKYKFIFGGKANILRLNPFTNLVYQDGSMVHPYINNKFTKKGHYKINGVITPIVKSESDYNKFMQIISTNQFLKTFSIDVLSPNYGTGISNVVEPSNIAQLQEKQIQNLANRTHGQVVYDKYGRPIAIEGKNFQMSINEPPIPKMITKEKAQTMNYKFYEKYDKIINGVKFDVVNNDNKTANERTGTINNPFLANEGPRGVAYYQIGGTNLMTPIPVDGFKLKPWFDALNRKPGSNFVVSQLPYGNGATSYKEKIGNYEVYHYNKDYTYDFGTITQPYVLNKQGSPNFTEGTPSFFRVKGSDGKYYVNAKPISTIKGIEEFYSALTNEKLGPKFHTEGKTYDIIEKGNGVEISELLRR